MAESVKKTNVDDDELLIRQALGGDEEAFLSLYHRRQAAIFRFALYMSGSTTIAEEVTQEVFLTLIKSANGSYDEQRSSAAAYLFGIARNHVLRYLSRNRKYVALESGEDGTYFDEPASEPGLLSEIARAELAESVRQAVLSLPPSYREVVALCALEEMSYAEASEALNVPIGTVRSRLSRARGLLEGRLRQQEVSHERRSR